VASKVERTEKAPTETCLGYSYSALRWAARSTWLQHWLGRGRHPLTPKYACLGNSGNSMVTRRERRNRELKVTHWTIVARELESIVYMQHCTRLGERRRRWQLGTDRLVDVNISRLSAGMQLARWGDKKGRPGSRRATQLGLTPQPLPLSQNSSSVHSSCHVGLLVKLRKAASFCHSSFTISRGFLALPVIIIARSFGGLDPQTLSASKYDRNVYRTKFAAA
jgi:hypothetical protein